MSVHPRAGRDVSVCSECDVGRGFIVRAKSINSYAT